MMDISEEMILVSWCPAGTECQAYDVIISGKFFDTIQVLFFLAHS
jgi:hypothetical protein